MNYWVDTAQVEAEDLVLAYHYSHRLPGNTQCVVTAHEDGGLFGDRGRAVAAVFFSSPPTRWSETVWELSRLVKIDGIVLPLTGLIAHACTIIRRRKACDLLVSFADSTQGHHGGIYQACSWHFNGLRAPAVSGLTINGEYVPGRTANARYGTRSPDALQEKFGIQADPVWDTGKYLYWRALNRSGVAMAKRLHLASLPYPKPDRAEVSA